MIGGFVLIAIAAIIFPNKYLNYQIHDSKQFVTVKLIELPNCNSGYRDKFLKLEYKGVKYILRISCKYVRDYQPGQQIQMLHKEGTSNFLFENEDVIFELIFDFIIASLGIIIVGIAIRNNKKINSEETSRH